MSGLNFIVLNAHRLLGHTLLSVLMFQLMAGYDSLSATRLQNFLSQVAGPHDVFR
jgi:hypothetical protein